MSDERALNAFRDAAAQVGARLPAALTPGTPIGDLGLDSIAVMELVVVVEQRLGIRIPDEDLVHAGTVGDLVRVVEQQTGRHPETADGRP
jgi:acyl carrier protein